MRTRSLLTIGFALFALAACHRGGSANHGSTNGVDVTFAPYSAVRSDATTDSAVRFYEGDKQALTKAGAQYVGELEVDAHGKKISERLWARAASEAAHVGATHFLLVETGAPRGRFALFRVDPNRWNDLPRELRPGMMAGEPTSTTTVTSAPIR